MTKLDLESDQFMQLLTDALRSGPGSPAWREALSRVRQDESTDGSRGQATAEEYRQLLGAREHLEAGRPYREIRAGAGFTRKVIEAISEEAQRPSGSGPSAAAIMALLAGLAALGAIVLISCLLLWSSPAKEKATPNLQETSFTHEISTTTFNGTRPAGWNAIGSAAATFDGAFAPADQTLDNGYHGCGLVTSQPFLPGQATAIDVQLRMPGKLDDVITQVFVTDDPSFTADRGISRHELVLSLSHLSDHGHTAMRQQVVLPDGSFPPVQVDNSKKVHDNRLLRIGFDADTVLVDSAGQRLYTGPHQLSANRPLYVGVRFLCRGNVETQNSPAVVSITISQ